MGNLRVFFKSVRFTTRTKKRFIVFVTIFALTAAFIAFFVNTLDGYFTSDYLDQRGVYLVQFDDHNVTQPQGNQLIQKVKNLNLDFELNELQLYRYIDIDNALRIYSINISRPWLHPWVNPEVVLSGKYPSKPDQVLIPEGDLQVRQTIGNIYVSSTVAVGSKFFLSNGTYTDANGTVLKLSVSGTFDASNFGGGQRNSLWMFVDDSIFDRIVQLYGFNSSQTYVHSASITVKTAGLIPTGQDYDNVATLKNEIENKVLSDTTVGIWRKTAITTSATVKKEARNRDITSFGFAIMGGVVLVFMFSYLLSKFRRREIAILKAMGYGKSSIRLTLIAEILTTAVTGFVLGMIGADGTLLYLNLRDISVFRKSALLRPEAILASFIIIVLVTLPGMMFATFRALRVSPMEAFRDRT